MSTETEEKQELTQAFWSANSDEEMLQALRNMERRFIDEEFGSEFLYVAAKTLNEGNNHEQVVVYAKKALTVFRAQFGSTTDNHHLYWPATLALAALGSACYRLNQFEDSLVYLNRASSYLSKLDEGADIALFIEMQLATVKTAMGKFEEAIFHAKNMLKMKEKSNDEGSVDIGRANLEVAFSYVNAFDYEQALPFGLKAFDIYKRCLVREPEQVTQVSSLLAVIYSKMRNLDKALVYDRVTMSFRKKADPNSLNYLIAVTEYAMTLTAMGRYREAIKKLKAVVSRGYIQGDLHVKSHLAMARALFGVGERDGAKHHMEIAQKELEKERDPMSFVGSHWNMAMLCQEMKDCKTAISLLTKGLKVTGLPQNLIAELSAAFMSLISQSREGGDEVAYWKIEVGRLEATFGPKHCVVGYGYSILGAAYLTSDQKNLGAESLVQAKAILDVTLGHRHLISLDFSHRLSVAYGTLKRYQEAYDIDKKVIQGLQGLKPSAEQFLLDVIQHLNDMDDKIKESRREAASQSKDKEDLSSKVSQCSNSDD